VRVLFCYLVLVRILIILMEQRRRRHDLLGRSSAFPGELDAGLALVLKTIDLDLDDRRPSARPSPSFSSMACRPLLSMICCCR